MTSISPLKNEMITFNTHSTNYPKFEIYNNPRIVTDDDIMLVIFTEMKKSVQYDTIIDTIINYYKEIDDIQYIMQYLDVPFSFLLIDLNIHRPQYKIYLVIQSYDSNIYYKSTGDGGAIQISMEPSMEASIAKGVMLSENTIMKWGKIHLFTLDQKVLSVWKYNDKNIMDISYSPPFYITYHDFFNFVIGEKENGAPANYGQFLLNILLSIIETNGDQSSAILYNYNVKQCINTCKFTTDQYTANATLLKFYLLIYHESRFTERHIIVDFLKKGGVTGIDNV